MQVRILPSPISVDEVKALARFSLAQLIIKMERTIEEIEKDIERNKDLGFHAIGNDKIFDDYLERNSELLQELRERRAS